jgi:hypothetical protein
MERTGVEMATCQCAVPGLTSEGGVRSRLQPPPQPAPTKAHHFGTRKKLKTNCKSDTHDLSLGATARGEWRNAASSHIAGWEREVGGQIELRAIILGKQA